MRLIFAFPMPNNSSSSKINIILAIYAICMLWKCQHTKVHIFHRLVNVMRHHSKWHQKRSCDRKTVEYTFSNQLSVRILKVNILFHFSMAHSIGEWPVSWVYGPFHVCMARFKSARAVHRCTTTAPKMSDLSILNAATVRVEIVLHTPFLFH